MFDIIANSACASAVTYSLPVALRLFSSPRDNQDRDNQDTRVEFVFAKIRDAFLAIKSGIISVIGINTWKLLSCICENAWISVFVVTLLLQFAPLPTVWENVSIGACYVAIGSMLTCSVRLTLEENYRERAPNFAAWVAPQAY